MNLIRKFNPTQLFVDGMLGQYSLGLTTGLIAAATSGELVQFQWSDPSRLAAVRKIAIGACNSTPWAAGAAVPLTFDLVLATGWSAQGTGGTSVDVSTGTGRRRKAMPASLVPPGNIRIATTAALGAGTKTLDTQPLATINGNLTNGSSVMAVAPGTALFDYRPAENDYPIVLQPQDGFVIRLTSNPGTGTFFLSVSVEWDEVSAS